MNPQPVQHATAEEDPIAGLSELGRDRLPNRDLWAGIEPRLARPHARRRREPLFWPYALAASVSVAVLAGALLREYSPVDPQASGLTQLAAVTESPPVDTAPQTQTPYSNAESGAHGSAVISSRSLRTLRSESLDNAPALVAERAEESGLFKATYSTAGNRGSHSQLAILRANLQLVSQAEREVRRALRSEPESASLKRLLTVAQEKRAVLATLLIHEQD